MFKLTSDIQALIRKTCKGKAHIKLTIGTYAQGQKVIQTFGESGEIPHDNFVYDIGSVTKTFTASLLAKYVHEGKMSLGDPISKYIHGLDPSTYYPTLQRLVTHTSGYGHYPATLGEGISALVWPAFTGVRGKDGRFLQSYQIEHDKLKQLVASNIQQDKDHPWAYSNFGMGLVGYAIGVASGLGYQATMEDFLRNELGMAHSHTGLQAGGVIGGFSKKNQPIPKWDYNQTLIAGTGCINATANDLLTYAKLNMHEEKPYLAMCHQKQVVSKRIHGGMAWVMKKDDDQVIAHTGGSSTYDTLLVIDKRQKIGVVVQSNYLIGLNRFYLQVLKDLAGK